MKQQRPFVCKHCGHVLNMPRAGMTLQEAKFWFKYATCPVCKGEVRVVEQVPPSVVATYTQPSLWAAGEEEQSNATR